MWGRRYHTGENHGTPFHTSTSASERPIRPASSAAMARGNTEYRLPRRTTSYPWRRAVGGNPTAADVRCTMSSPAAAHRRMNSSACSSDPPASGSSRSRHASTCTRRTPAVTTSPTSSSIASAGVTSRNLPTATGTSDAGNVAMFGPGEIGDGPA